jgi:hypothetical protein
MKIYINTLLGLLLCLVLNTLSAQQMEVEYDSGAGNPHLLIKETGPTTSFSRITMQNQLPGFWTLAARNGTSTDFNIFYDDETTPGQNYLNIDPNNNLTTIITDFEVADGDIEVSGSDPDLILSSSGAADPSILFGTNGGSSASRIWYDSSEDVLKLGTSTTQGGININEDNKVGIDIDDFSSTEELDAQLTIKANSGNLSTPAHLELYENNNSGEPNIHFTNFNRTAYWELRGGSEQSSTIDGFMRFIHSDNGTTNQDQILVMNGSDGLVGVNDATPEYTLSIDHGAGSPSTGSDDGLNIQNTSNNDSWTLYTRTSSGDLQFFYDASTGTGANPILRGTIDAGNGTYTNNSDRRLKKNITTLTDQLDKVMQMRPTRYQFKDQDNDDYSLGLIAQEIQEIIPEVVTNISSVKEDGAEYLGVSYSELIPVLIGAIQDQQAIINSQNAYITQIDQEMDAMNVSLEARVNDLVLSVLAKKLKDTSVFAQEKVSK